MKKTLYLLLKKDIKQNQNMLTRNLIVSYSTLHSKVLQYYGHFYYLFEEEQTYKQFIETVRRCLDITVDRSVDYAFGNLHFSPCVTPYFPAW